MRIGTRLAVVSTAFALGIAPSAAFAVWQSPGTGSGTATATTVNRGNAPTATRGNGTVSLGWTASTLASGAPVGRYDVVRHDGASTSVVCPGVTTTSCTDLSPLAGSVTYGVVPRIGTYWTGPESPLSGFQYDIFAPTTTITRNPAGTDSTWNKQDVSITLTATDPGAPASGVKEIHYVVNGGTPVVVAGKSTTFTVTSEQVNQIDFWSVDNLGNIEATHSTAQVNIDKTAPTTTASLTAAPNAAGWNNTDLSVLLSATDGTAGATSGVTSTEYSFTGAAGSWTPYPTAGGIPVTTEGTKTVYYRSWDVAGNVEQPQTQVVRLDKHAPTSTGSLSGSSLTLSATDAGPSGVARIEYKIGTGSTYATYTDPVALQSGQTAYFHAVDVAGNVESPDHTVTNNADVTGPNLAFVDLVEGSTYVNNSGGTKPWSAVCGTGRVCVNATDVSGILSGSVSYTLEATTGSNAGQCWSGSAFVNKPLSGGCVFVPLTLGSNRYEGTAIPNGNMKAGAYTVIVKAQDASPAHNASSTTLQFKIS